MLPLMNFLPNKATLITAGVAALLLAGAGAYIWILRAEADTAELTITQLTKERDALAETVRQKNRYIESVRQSEAENRKFQADEYEKMEGIKKDAPIDPDILGPAFFDGLR